MSIVTIGALVLAALIVVLLTIWLIRRQSGIVTHTIAPTPAPLPAGSTDDELRELVARGQKIEAIKRLRNTSNLDLKGAKDYVESLAAGQTPARPDQQTVPQPIDRSALDAQARALAADNRIIEAIKLVREQTGLGLREAKEYVERL